MEEITQLITNVGFPIVACIYMAKQQQASNTMITDLTSTLKLIEKSITSMDNEIKQLKEDTQKFKIPQELMDN